MQKNTVIYCGKICFKYMYIFTFRRHKERLQLFDRKNSNSGITFIDTHVLAFEKGQNCKTLRLYFTED